MTNAKIVIAIKSKLTGEAISKLLTDQIPSCRPIACDTWAKTLQAKAAGDISVAVLAGDLVPEHYRSSVGQFLTSGRVILIDDRTPLELLLQHIASQVGGDIVPAKRGQAPSGNAVDPGDSLTGREKEIFGLMVEGLSNKQIAARLFITQRTVKFHVSNILRKLKSQSRTEAVSHYLRFLGRKAPVLDSVLRLP